jgi:PAT family beta-lactamase induction signal transducer AmpG
MWAAKSAGTVVGGSAGTLLAAAAGWPAVFAMLAALVLGVLGVVLSVRETDGAAPRAEARPPDFAALRRAFGHLRPWLALAVGLVSPVGYALLSAPFTIFLREDLGWTEPQIALQAGLDPWMAVAGALTGGFLADRYGVRPTMGGAMAAIGVLLGAYALVPGWWPVFAVTLGFSLLQSLLVAVYSAASLTFFMAFCDPAVGATQFALYMASANLTYAWTGPAGGWLSERGGAPLVLAVAAVAQLAAIPALLLADPAARPTPEAP